MTARARSTKAIGGGNPPSRPMLRFVGTVMVWLLLFAVAAGVANATERAAANTAAPATPTVKLKPSIGPATTRTRVVGREFGPNEAVNVTFDGAGVATASTGPKGTFFVRFDVPLSALPGDHAVQATGQTSGLTATAAFLVRTDWASMRFDAANTGDNPFENVLSASNISNLGVAWSAAGPTSSPAVAGGILYADGGGVVDALDSVTGQTEWSQPVDGTLTPPTIADGTVFVASDTGDVTALDAGTGSVVWSFAPGGPIYQFAPPTVAGGVVYVGDRNGAVYALDDRTGAERWSSQPGGTILRPVAVVNGLVFASVADADVDLVALRAKTGLQVWSFANPEYPDSAPIVAGGMVYVSAGTFYALDAATGAVRWSRKAIGYSSTPALARGVLYILAGANTPHYRLIALDAASGRRMWSLHTGKRVFSDVVAANGLVYFCGGYRLAWAVDVTRERVVWTHDVGESHWSPVVADGRLFVTGAGGVTAFTLP